LRNSVLRTSKAGTVAEIAMVFLIAAVVVGVGWSLVGPNAPHRQAVVWVANVLMLGTVWIGLRVRGQGWAELGLRLRGTGVRAVVRLIVQAIVVLILGIVAFVAGGIVMQSVAAAAAAADTSGYTISRATCRDSSWRSPPCTWCPPSARRSSTVGFSSVACRRSRETARSVQAWQFSSAR
jgi:hypothetical protein